MKIDLRDYQLEAVEAARQAVREGYKNILICAPTGSGKTVIASYLIDESRNKGKRANFVVDRKSLINQTDEIFDLYGIEHGVIQGDHPRFRPSLQVQLCSQQTLGKRRWPESNLDIIDECHTTSKVVDDRIMPRERITIGLTATPFPKGLGKRYDHIINVTTTNELIRRGFLAPFRIFSCVEPDMTGVKVVGGEFEEKETEKRALQVVGDVVAEYIKHGEGRKFICSAVNTAHVEALQQQFIAAGINVATYTYKDKDEDRTDTVNEFRKANSSIAGLITITAASKGFDLPAISCVIMARPLRKSLAEHIQFFGRGLRIADGKTDCIARGTLVLTDRGEVPIEQITTDHRVWDGVNFVRHLGAVCKGVQRVIEYDGLVATPDHEVMTNDGWTRFEDAARGQRRITRTGVGGIPLRHADDHRAGVRGVELSSESEGQLQCLRAYPHGPVLQHDEAPQWHELSDMSRSDSCEGAALAVLQGSSNVEPMHEPELENVPALWRSGHRVSVPVGELGRAVDCGQPGYSGRPINAGRSNGEQRALRTWEPALGNAIAEREQHATSAEGSSKDALHCLSETASRGQVRGRDSASSAQDDDLRRGGRPVFQPAFEQTQREVWDVLNAGPLQRFTANGRLVHNCIVLDHSGNCARMWSEWNHFFENGWGSLDDGKKKETAEANKPDEIEMAKCPACNRLHRPAPFCPACGHEYPKRNRGIEHVPGTLKELVATGNRELMVKHLWPQVVGYVQNLVQSAGAEVAQRHAQAIYKDMTGQFAYGRVDNTTPEPPTTEVLNKIRSLQIRRAKAKQAEARRAGVPA